MSAPPLLCAGLEIALNRYLALEPEVLADVARLEGRVIALHANGPGWDFFLCPHRGGVQVLDAVGREPDVRISAQPVALMQRLLGSGEHFAGGLDGEGEAHRTHAESRGPPGMVTQAFHRERRRAQDVVEGGGGGTGKQHRNSRS